jgi:hypothetical protein
LRTDHKSLLDGIRTKGELSDDLSAELKGAVERYAKGFA